MLKRKKELNYRKGLTWKDCSGCLAFVSGFKVVGIGGELLGEEGRCKTVGLEPGRQYRILPHYICISHNPRPVNRG